MNTTRHAGQSFPVTASLCALAAVLILPPDLRAAAEQLTPTAPSPAQISQPIPWADIGDQGHGEILRRRPFDRRR